jgi:hypothetical protein
MHKGTTVLAVRYVWNRLTPEQRREVMDNAANVAKQGGRLVAALNQQRRAAEPAGASPREIVGEIGQDLKRLPLNVKEAGRLRPGKEDQDGAAEIEESSTNGSSRPNHQEGVTNA